MGTLMLEQIKKQTTNFLQEKYKIARMKFTDVTEAELLAEQATNKDPCSPDAKTMTRIAEASFELDDYWRIVDLLHQRLCTFNCEDWRRSYKALVLLEFLLTHGPEDFAVEFQCDSEVIEELGSFTHVDERGFNWGARMQKISDQILQLLQGGTTLREARLKALKITNEIHGFGSLDSPSSSSTPSSSNSDNPHASSSFCSSFSSTSSTPTFIDSITEFTKNPFSPSKDITNISYSPIGVVDENPSVFRRKKNHAHYNNNNNNNNEEENHIWDAFGEDKDNLVGYSDYQNENENENENADDEEDEEEEKPKEKPKGFVNGICSKIIGSANNALRGGRGEKIEFRSLSDVGRKANKKRFERQNSLWY